MPLVANAGIVGSDKITLKLEDLACRSWLKSFIVETDIPYTRSRVLTITSFCLVNEELLAGCMGSEQSCKVMRLDSLVFEQSDYLVCSHSDTRHQAWRSCLGRILASNEDPGPRSQWACNNSMFGSELNNISYANIESLAPCKSLCSDGLKPIVIYVRPCQCVSMQPRAY